LAGKVIWITGLAGSGKSTLAKNLHEEMTKKVKNTILLDGDELREILLNSEVHINSYNKEERIKLSFIYSKLCQLISNNEVNVIIATISLFKEIHIWNRNNLKNYFEIYLNFSKEVLSGRDQKQIYSNFRKGTIKNVVGLDLGFDVPKADLIIDDRYDKDILGLTEYVVRKIGL
jgi:adenylylsulfate kinase-like enzyme